MKKIIAITFFSLALMAVFITYILTNKDSSNQSNNIIKVESTNLELLLNPATIDARKPYSENTVSLVSNITGTDITKKVISPASELIVGENFTILIYAGGEGNPIGLDTPIPDIQTIFNDEIKDIKRLGYSNSNHVKTKFAYNDLEYDYEFVYTTDIKINDDCIKGEQNIYCGIDYIFLEESNAPIVYIQCGVNDPINVKYCDEFVSNLRIV